jgi:hypothetical protein
MARTEDSHLAKMASQVIPSESNGITDPAEVALPETFPAIPVRDESPALGIWRTVTLTATNPVKVALPQDPRRRGAYLASDGKAVVCGSKEEAQASNAQASTGDIFGYYLNSTGVPVRSKGIAWVTYTSDATLPVHVSVLIEKDDE